MGLYIADPGEVGVGCEDIGIFLPIINPRKPALWVRDVGRDPPYGKDPVGISSQDSEMDHGKTPPYPSRREL